MKQNVEYKRNKPLLFIKVILGVVFVILIFLLFGYVHSNTALGMQMFGWFLSLSNAEAFVIFVSGLLVLLLFSILVDTKTKNR